MIEGGSLGTHIREHSKLGISGSFQISDDGTYYVFKLGGVTIMKIQKSNLDLFVGGDVKANQTL